MSKNKNNAHVREMIISLKMLMNRSQKKSKWKQIVRKNHKKYTRMKENMK